MDDLVNVRLIIHMKSYPINNNNLRIHVYLQYTLKSFHIHL